MGAFFTNFHVRTEDAAAVAAVVGQTVRGRAYVSPDAKGGWVTVYDETGDSQDEKELARVATALSKELNTAVFWFLVHDSDIFMYGLYQAGALADEFSSAPDYFGDVPESETRRLQGRPEKLLPHCTPGTTIEQVREALEEGAGFAENAVRALAALLAVDEERCAVGFNYYEEMSEEGDGAKFTPVSSSAADQRKRKKRARGPSPKQMMDDILAKNPAMKLLDEEQARANRASDTDPYVAAVVTFASMVHAMRQRDAMMAAMGWNGSKEAAIGKRVVLGMTGKGPWGTKTPDQPTGEEMYAACQRGGVDELIALVAERTPGVLAECARAAVRGVPELLRAVIDRGTDVNARDPEGRSLLLEACLWPAGAACVDLLLARAADVNAADARGITPLMYAALAGNAAVAEKLLTAGANPAATRTDGQTAMSWARMKALGQTTGGNGQAIMALLDRLGGKPNT